MKRFFYTVIFIVASLSVGAQSFQVDFTPAQFLNWCLTSKDFDANVVRNDSWNIESALEVANGGGVITYYANLINSFVSIAYFEHKDGQPGFYALNLPDGKWILQLMNELLTLRDAGSLKLKYNSETGDFVASNEIFKLEISFGKAMFVVTYSPA